MSDVREKILKSARETFLECGYRNATIRKIMVRAGVQTGSVYHFFDGKEDIFSQLFKNVFTQCDDLIQSRCADRDPAFRAAMLCAVMLRAAEKNERALDFYYEGYGSPRLLEAEAENIAGWSRRNFAAFAPDDAEWHRPRALAVTGALRNLLAGQYFKEKPSLARCTPVLITAVLSTYGLSPQEVEAARQKVAAAAVDADWLAGALIGRYLAR